MTQRNDAVNSVLFKRELEHIQAETDDVLYPDYRYAEFVPTGSFGMAEQKNVYTYRTYDRFGTVKWIQSYADDLPKVNIKGTETSLNAKRFGNAYGFDDDEVMAWQSEGGSLDREGADTARMAHEQFFDVLGSTGDSTVGLKGLLNLANTTSFTPGTKTAGGTAWGTLVAPNATVNEIIADMAGIASAIIAATKGKGILTPNAILLPIEQYTHIASRKLGDGSDVTILKHFLSSNPWIKTVDHWWRCDGAAGSSVDRMVCYRRDPKVVKFVVNRNFKQSEPLRVGSGHEVRCESKTVGVICPYPLAVAYGDGI